MGIGFLSEAIARPYIDERPLSDAWAQRNLVIIRRKDRRASPAAARVFKLLRDQVTITK